MIAISKIDIETLTKEMGIDSSSVAEILKLYCEEMAEEMELARDLICRQDWAGLRRTIHNIKGVSSNLYLQDMVNASQEVDLRLKSNEYDNIESPIQCMLDVFDCTVKGIQKALELYVQNSKCL